MADLVFLGVLVTIFVLYAADRAVKARSRVRQLRRMSRRLAAAAARAEEQHAERQAADAASQELTSVMPAINLRLPVTPPKQAARGDAPRDRRATGPILPGLRRRLPDPPGGDARAGATGPVSGGAGE